jgi:hypothetical protein
MVALGGPTEAPSVILRRHVVIASGPKQPYHAAASLPLSDAGVFIKRCADSALTLAVNAVQAAVAELEGMGYEIAGTGVLMGSGRQAGDLAQILSSHPLLHTAEGQLYRNVLQQACEACGLVCAGMVEKELKDPPPECRSLDWGKAVGPPWGRDQKLAAIAAWHILAGNR